MKKIMSLQEQYDGLMNRLNTIYSQDEIQQICSLGNLSNVPSEEQVVTYQLSNNNGN